MKWSRTRREFLRDAGVLAAVGASSRLLAGCGEDRWAHEDIADDANYPDGVLAGPRVGGVTLLLQVADLRGTPRLGLEIARDHGFDDVVVRRIVTVPALAPDVPLTETIDDAELVAGVDYVYRWATHAGTSPIGRFRTLRDAGDTAPVRLGFFSCQGYPAGYYTAHQGLAAEPALELVVSLGDYIYDWTDDVGPADRVDDIGAAYPGLAESVEEYRRKYKLYRSDPDLQLMHTQHGMLAVWDNHELAAELTELGPRLPLDARTENGKQAFWEQMPLSRGPDAEPLYRAIRVGAHVELLLLDLHSYAAPPASGGSYLGAAQLAWLLGRLAQSTARWKLLATSTVMMGLDLTAGTPVNLDQWDGYPDERRAIVEHVRANGIGGVVALSGDLHTMLVAPVTTTGRSDGDVGFPEVSVGAISSQGLFDLLPGQEDYAASLVAFALEVNPHVALMDILTRGYAVVEADADRITVTLRGVGTVYERTSSMRDVARIHMSWPGTTFTVD